MIDPDPPRSAVRTVAAQERFRALQPLDGDELAALARMVADAGPAGLAVSALTARGGVAPGSVSAMVERLADRALAVLAGDRLVNTAVISALTTRLMTLVEDFHRANPLADGIPREEARERLFARGDPAVFELVLARLAAEGRVIVRDRIARAGHRLELSADETRARDAIEQVYRRAGLKPPDANGVAAESGVATGLAEKMTTLLLRQKRLTRVDTLIFHADALAGLKSELKALREETAAEGASTIDVSTFKERYGVTRKFAIPLLEWLDRERVTKRMGEVRVIL